MVEPVRSTSGDRRAGAAPIASAADAGDGTYSVERLLNGYWRAEIRLPWPPGPDYVQSADLFHDEQEARDWADFMIGFLTCREGCCS